MKYRIRILTLCMMFLLSQPVFAGLATVHATAPVTLTGVTSSEFLLQANDFSHRLERARQLSSAFRDEEALQAYKSVLELDADHFESLWNVVMLHTSIGHRQDRSRDEEAHYKQAFQYAQLLLEAHPQEAGSHFAYSAAVGRKAQSVGARERLQLSAEIREHAEKAIALDPKYSRAWNVLGNWHHRAANLSRLERMAANALFGGAPEGASNESAMQAFEKAIELDPHFILYYHDKAEFLITIGEKDNARRILRRGLQLNETTSDDARWKANMREMLAKL